VAVKGVDGVMLVIRDFESLPKVCYRPEALARVNIEMDSNKSLNQMATYGKLFTIPSAR